MFNLFLILITAYFIGFLPGFLLYATIFKNKRKVFYEAMPLSLALSMAVLVLPAFLGFHYGLSLDFVFYCFLIELLIIIGVFLYVYRSSLREFFNLKIKKSSFYKNKYLKILLIILLLVLFKAILTPGFQDGDTLRHINEIRKIVEFSEISFGASFIKEYQGVGNYGYNLLHLFLALVAKISSLDIIEVIRFIPVFISVFLLLAYFYFSKELFNSEKIALYATGVLFIWEIVLGYHFIYPGIANYWTWSQLIPSFIARNILIFSTLALVFTYLRSGKNKYLYLFPVLSLTTAFLHIHYFGVLVLLLGLVLVFLFIFRFNEKVLIKRMLISFILVSAPALPYVFFIASKLYPIRNLLYELTLVAGNRPVRMVAGFPVIDPFKVIYLDFVHKLAYLLMPLLIFLVRKKRYAVYLLALFLGPLLIIFNPPLLKFLQKFNPALDRVWRLNEILPYTQIVGLFLFLFVAKFKKELKGLKRAILERPRREKILAAGLMLIIVLTLCYKSINIAYFNSSTMGKNMIDTLYLWKTESLKAFAQNTMPVGSVVLMDNIISGIWPYYYPHYVVSVNWGVNNHIPVSFNQYQRYNDVEKYLAQERLNSWSFEFLDKYGVDYVLVNKHVKNNDMLMGKIKEKHIERMPFQEYEETTYYQQKDFEFYPEKFELIYGSDDVKIYRYKRS